MRSYSKKIFSLKLCHRWSYDSLERHVQNHLGCSSVLVLNIFGLFQKASRENRVNSQVCFTTALKNYTKGIERDSHEAMHDQVIFVVVVSSLQTLTFSVTRGGSRTASTSKMERFVMIVNGFQPLTIITKCSILDFTAVLDPALVSVNFSWPYLSVGLLNVSHIFVAFSENI